MRRSGTQAGGSRGRAGLVAWVICVVLVLGFGAILLWPQSRSSLDRNYGIKTQIATLSHQIEMYNLNIGHYPTEAEGGLKALLVRPMFADPNEDANWAGPYVNVEQLKDQWGTDLHYKVSATSDDSTVPYKLWSSGPDGVDGTDDDIRNWSDSSGEPG